MIQCPVVVALLKTVRLPDLYASFAKETACHSHLRLCKVKDYCVDKNLVNVDPPKDDDPPSGTLYLRDEECRNGNKCSRCHGDCDEDNQCQGDLICFQRGASVKSVPGCSGTPFEGKHVWFARLVHPENCILLTVFA